MENYKFECSYFDDNDKVIPFVYNNKYITFIYNICSIYTYNTFVIYNDLIILLIT